MARKCRDSVLSYDERRKFKLMVGAIGRLKGNIFSFLWKYDTDSEEYKKTASIYSLAINLEERMKEYDRKFM